LGCSIIGDFGTSASNPFAAFQFAEPVTTTPETTIVIRIHQVSQVRRATLGRFRLALSAGPAWADDAIAGGTVEDNAIDESKEYLGLPARLLQTLAAPEAAADPAAAAGSGRTRAAAPAAQALIQTYFQLSSPDLAPLVSARARLEAAKAAIEMEVARVMVAEAMPEPRETRILPRGNWMDDSGAVVQPAIPEFLGPLGTGGRRATRLDLANWLTSAQNPLTARAYVNRTWYQFFGVGLSSTLGDLGSQGEWPSHLALLDWLATEFMAPQYDAAGAHAWDMKHLVRTIVTSGTYKQSSSPRPDLETRDPANRLLARQVPLRVDAEVVHDVALQVSGLLAERFGGPSVRPYQPDGYLAALNYPRRSYSADRGADLYRRALYIHWQRTFLHPSLAVFDAPSREECVLDRVVSDTPLQALDLLNDPIYVEAARVFAEGALKQGGTTISRQLAWIFSRALGRAPEPEELRTLSKLHAGSLARFQKSPAEARQLIRTGEYPVPANVSQKTDSSDSSSTIPSLLMKSRRERARQAA